MPTVKTVKPSGGGDFTTLDAWWTYASGQTGDQWAECYGGGNLQLTLVVGANDGSPTTLKIYAAPSDKHNGTRDTSKAYVDVTSNNFDFRRKNVTIDGIQFLRNSGSSYSSASVDLDNSVTIKNCLLSDQHSGNDAVIRIFDGQTGSVTATLQNNIFHKSGSTSSTLSTVILITTLTATNTVTVTIENNTVYSNQGYVIDAFTTSNKPTVNLRNNILMNGSGNLWNGSTFTGAITSGTIDYNIYTGASTLGGTHNITGVTPSNVITNVNSDWSLPASSPAIDSGTSIAGISFDIIGTSRPQGPAYDIGAFEKIDTTNNPNDRYYDEVIVDRPIAYYREADSSSQMQDSSGNAHHGTHNSFVVEGQSSLLYRNINQSVYYPTNGNSTFPSFLTGPVYTFEFWMLFSQQLQGKIFSVNNGYGFFEPNSDVSGKARVNFGGKFVDSLDRLQLGRIYYVVIILENGRIELYINDVFQGFATGAYHLYRLHSIAGPYLNEASYTTTADLAITNFGYIAAGSAKDAVFNNISGTATTHASPDILHPFPSDHFRWSDSENRIWLEDLFGRPESDNDFNDDYWLVDIERINDNAGNNQVGINYVGRFDEFAIYDYRLPAARQTKHYQTGKFPDLTNGYAPVDVLTPIDTVSMQHIAARSLTDTLTISDFSGKARSLTETLHVVDYASRIHLGKLVLNEILEIHDAADALVIGDHLIQFVHTELLRINDFVGVDKVLSLKDTLNITDSVATPGLFFTTLTTTINVIDTVTFTMPGKIFRNCTDRITIFDSVSYTTPQKHFNLIENINLNDTLTMTGPKRLSLRDTLTFNDSVLENLKKYKLTDSLNIQDSARANLHRESLTESLNLIEKLRVSPIKLGLAEPLTITDRATFFLNHIYLTETINLNEFVSVRYGIWNGFVTDQLTINDSLFLRWGRFNGRLVEQLTINDFVKRIREFSLNEVLTIVDILHRIFPFVLVDALTLTDTVTYLKVKPLKDILTIQDFVCLCFTPHGNFTDILNIQDRVLYRLNNQNNQAGNGDRDHVTLRQILNIRMTDTIIIHDFAKLPRVANEGCCFGPFVDKLNLNHVLAATKVHSGIPETIPPES